MTIKLSIVVLISLMTGCASSALKNPFQLNDGEGAELKNTVLDGMLSAASFKRLNCTELKHGHMMVQNARYRVPSGPAFISVHVRWAQTPFGPVYFTNVDFELTLKEGEFYSISGAREEKTLKIKLVDDSGKDVTGTKSSDFTLSEGRLAMPYIPEYVPERCEKNHLTST